MFDSPMPMHRLQPTRYYAPTIESDLVREQVQQLTFSPSANGEYQIDRNGFKAIAVVISQQLTPEERQDHIEDVRLYTMGHSQEFTFHQEEIQVIASARQNSLAHKLGYGWYSTQTGNLYARTYGREAAEGKPNYRNNFFICIWAKDKLYQFDLYCNTSSAQTALTEIVAYYNQLR